MPESKLPNKIDELVGQRIRWRRKELKWTQEQLSERLSLTFQQVQKYEKGVNRISAGRLYEMSRVLEVPVFYFFDGAEEYLSLPGQFEEETSEAAPLPQIDQEAMELVSAFQKIRDEGLRKSLLATIKAAAAAEPTNS
ncbi:MAG: DNA-binding protein [Henriciella sp.]|jgi:transcriptional regulator with XRE-family HTH domain|uniref:helix-turn-helix domain-containing protein n=1 Tax=Henriciella sp. TaxID=1968823 RepID=UPI000C11C645|nr:helix-turn-helix transcriptional regulator [Henriciella sp.]MBK75818.1 DNA-binding protein [Henriciella sp.]PHR80160.1 MAG: DNA-binding protein [Henriciella sp.]|tara:strand:+ start:111 stop:524 length:414 start_codon:yes stop_codon:yes gene_type:complete